MPRYVKTFGDVNNALRDLYDYYDYLRTKNVDFSQRRIINAHPSIDDYDYVVRKELIDTVGGGLTGRRITSPAPAKPSATKLFDKITFGVGIGASAEVGNDATPPFIWSNTANGRPDIIATAANTPPTGADFKFDILLNGSIFVSYALPAGTGSKVVLHESIPNPPVIHRYDVVSCNVTRVGSGEGGRGITIVIFCNLL